MNTAWGPAPLTIAYTNESLGSPNLYYWNFGDGTTSTVRDPVHTYTIPGVYSVSLKASNDKTAGITTFNNAVTVTAGPIPSPTPILVPGDLTVTFSADRTSGIHPWRSPSQINLPEILHLGDGILEMALHQRQRM